MDFRIENLDEMIFVQAEGVSRHDAKEKMDNHLNEINVKPIKYFYLEIFSKGKIAGAMIFALVNDKPDSSRKFRVNTVKPSPYLVVDLPYEKLLLSESEGGEHKIDFVSYIKQQGYEVAGFPFYEFLNDDDIRIYVVLK